MPVHLESALRHELGGSTFITIRGPSQRPNLEYRVATKKTSREMEEFLMEQVTSKFARFDPADRMIIFCFSIADTKAVHALLSPDLRVGIYSGEMETRRTRQLSQALLKNINVIKSERSGDVPSSITSRKEFIKSEFPNASEDNKIMNFAKLFNWKKKLDSDRKKKAGDSHFLILIRPQRALNSTAHFRRRCPRSSR